jgi:ribosomal protein L22
VDEAKMDKLAASLPELRGKLAKTKVAGRIQSDSIFSDEVAQTEEPATGTDTQSVQGIIRSKSVLDRALDPDPRSRVRWERKMVIRHVAKATNPFSREKRADRIRRTEKEIRVRSPFLPTSWKKLVHLSRQIAGKTVDDALVQMRYSKKKMAKEIAYHLELAKDRAIVERGMGLGKVKVKSELAAAEGEEGREAKAQGEKVEVQEIQNKAGKWMEIEDPTKLYIAQSWINRGPWRGRRYVFRARGRCDMLLSPSTGKSLNSGLMFPIY